MRVGYHNHVAEFKPVADRIPWEVVFSNAGPDVIMQLDICHCMDGGGDPVAILEEIPPPHGHHPFDRARRSAGRGHRRGRRAVETRSSSLCETICDTQWYVVEQERYKPGVPTMESARLCLENLRKMGK